MEKPDLKPSPLLDPKLLRSLPIATRMYVIGNFVREILEYTQGREIELFSGNTLVTDKPTPNSKSVNVITKPNSPGTNLPNSVGGELASGSATQFNPGLDNLNKYVANDTNPINMFFNAMDEVVNFTPKNFPDNDTIRLVEEVLTVGASQFGIDVVDVFKDDVNTLNEAIEIFQKFVVSEDGILFNPAVFSSKFPADSKNWKNIKSKLNAFDKTAVDKLFKGVEALENLITPILNMNKGHSLNDQRWNLLNIKPVEDGTPIGSIIDTGDVINRNDPGLLRNIKIHNKKPLEQFSDLIKNNATEAVRKFIPFAELPRLGIEKNTLYPTAKQFREILEDMGVSIDNQLKDKVQKKMFEQAYDELLNTIKDYDDFQHRKGNIQKAFSKMFNSLNVDVNNLPNLSYQLFTTVNRFADSGFQIKRKENLINATAKEKAIIFLHEILYDGTVNNDFQNIENILKSIIAEDALDVDYFDKEGYNFDIFKTDNYNDPNALKAWLNDTFINSVKGKKALIEKINPDAGNLLFPNKALYNKYAENIAEVPDEIKTLINSFADNFGIDWMADGENFKQVMDAIQKEDPAAFAKINQYYNSANFKESVKERPELFKFKPTNWQDDTNHYVYRQVQDYLSSHPNLDKTIFTDEVIRKGLTYQGTIDPDSELFTLLEKMRDIYPEFIFGLNTKIASTLENAQEAVKMTQNAFQNIDAKYIPALMNKKHNVASLGQMMIAAQQVLTNHTANMLDVEGTLFKLQDNPNVSYISPVNFSPFEVYEEMLGEPGGQLIGQGYPDLQFGIGSDTFDFEDAQYFDLADPDDRKYTLYGVVDDLMNNKVNIAEDVKLPVIFNDEFTVMDRNVIIQNLLSELRTVINDPMMVEDFMKLVVSSYGDKLPPIAEKYLKTEGTDYLRGPKLNFPDNFGENLQTDEGSIRHGDTFNTYIETPTGEKIKNMYGDITTTYSSPYAFGKDAVKGQDFTNHVMISAAKELFAQGYEDIATDLLNIEGGELDIWREFDEDVLKELKKILITELDRGNGGEIGVFTTTTGAESPNYVTKNTLRTATFDTLGLSVLEGEGARGELMILQDGMKVLDMSKWTPISRNNAASNSIVVIPGQGEKVHTGALQYLQDPLNPANIINLTEPVQPGLAVKLKSVEGITETGETVEDFVPEYPYNWLDRAANERHIHPVNGKYQIGDTVSHHANTIINPKTPTQIPIDLLPHGISNQAIKTYLKNKDIGTIEDMINKKNFIIQTMQNSAKKLSKFINQDYAAADMSVAYVKTSELLKFVEDNRMLQQGRVDFGIDNISQIAKNMMEKGFMQYDTGTMQPSDFVKNLGKVVDALPLVRFNPNNNAFLLQDGNHRVQAMALLGIDYVPVFFQFDPAVVEGKDITKYTPLSALGTNQDVTTKVAAGTKIQTPSVDEGINKAGRWKKTAKYIVSPEINKNMLIPMSTVSDFTLHPNYGTLSMYQNMYNSNYNSLRQYRFFENKSPEKTIKFENAINNNQKYFVDTANTSLDNMEIALEGMRQWFNKNGTQSDKDAIKLLIELHPTQQDFAAFMNTVQTIQDPTKLDITDITSARLGLSQQDYSKQFDNALDFSLLSSSMGNEYSDQPLLPLGEEDFKLKADGKMKVNQFVDTHHSVFERKPNMVTDFLIENKDLLGPGNIKLPTEDLEYVTVKPQKLEIAGVSGQRTVHSSVFDDILQVNIDAGIMSVDDAVAYKQTQNKSYLEKMFKDAARISKFHKDRLKYSVGTVGNYVFNKIQNGTAFVADDFKFNTLKGQQLTAFNTTKTARGLKAAGTVGGVVLDAATIPFEIGSLFTNTIKYYDDPDFGAATGLGKYGIGPKEIFQELLPGDIGETDRFRNNNIATAIAKGGINAFAWLAKNTAYRNLADDPQSFSPVVRPKDYDPEIHGKNLRQLYLGFEFNPRGMLDSTGGDKTFIEKKEQPFIQDFVYLAANALKYSPAFANVRRKVTGATTEQQRDVAKEVGYDILGDILTTPANMEEENGN